MIGRYSYNRTRRNGHDKGVDEGVFHNKKRNMWIVRIKKSNGTISTLAQYKDKKEAENKYNEAKSNVL